ncbi:hypothetical protein H9M94_02510 [Mycoplasma sp. Pen4]|uniref:hypothetical protein n=1 Tax=Mycoplasma sp. Pen4 TaxID=640330 RepID=UPI001654B9B4|nr:hypothetical protein [Mycoplasma sp. Pen4]QNM93326.1 hypothetical protein H9M94_01695 [Mycoplasma sp. Pen4]QNM93459.1 hypothetical protein H9M94_02510 [Mycoplasma sp. Pen4]
MNKWKKPMRMKFFWLWIVGAIFMMFIPYSIIDLVNSWYLFDTAQIVIVISIITIATIFSFVSIIYLFLQLKIIKKKRKLTKKLIAIQKENNPENAKTIKQIENEIEVLNKTYFK